jgi:fumarate reductase (CoM/CoB) subunit A
MWKYVAIIRNAEGLRIAREKIKELKGRISNLKVTDVGAFNKDLQDALEIEMMLNIADLVAESALIREESRGAHYRSDYPKTRDEWKKSIVLNKNKDIRFIRR